MTAAPEAPGGLARCLDAPRGISAEQALQRARNNLMFAQIPWRSQLNGALRQIAEAGQALAGPPSPGARARLTAAATDAFDIAGTFGPDALAQAAGSLIELLAVHAAAGLWDERAFALHLCAIELLREGGGEAVDEVAVVGGLRAVVAHLRQKSGLS